MNKRIIIILIIIAALASLVFFVTIKGNKTANNQNTAVQPQPNLSKLDFPLKVGNSWTYKRTVLAHEENEDPNLLWEGDVTVTVATILRLGDKWHITFSQTPEDAYSPIPEELWYADNTLYQDASLESENAIFKFPLSVGQVIYDDIPEEYRAERGDHYYQIYVDHLSHIDVPKKTSPMDCFVITSYSNPDGHEITFCPGIGIFRYYYKHNGTPLEFEWVLTDYSLK